jgi:hypothetical protein
MAAGSTGSRELEDGLASVYVQRGSAVGLRLVVPAVGLLDRLGGGEATV